MRSRIARDIPFIQKYDALFSIFLVVSAFLWRDNPDLVYPQILYLFLILMVLNLLGSSLLRRGSGLDALSVAVVLGNCAVITAILECSGGNESNLWVLYLLPIFTACLTLEARHVVWITAGAAVFNAAYHLLSVEDIGAPIYFALFLKTAVFLFAAITTWRIAQRDRSARQKLGAQTEELEILEEKLRTQASRMADTQPVAEIGMMASGVAHDLNAPLMVLQSSVELLSEFRADDEELRGYLNRMLRALKMCRSITMNLLGYARQDFALAPCDIHEVLNSVLLLYESTLTLAGVRVERSWGERLPQVRASAPHLQRLVLNVLSNARAAMKEGGTIILRTRLAEPGGEGASRRVEMIVEDSGPGIPPQIMAKLFTRFASTKAPGEGTGLGLSLCREIAIKHGGDFTVENKPAGGARCVLTLPAA